MQRGSVVAGKLPLFFGRRLRGSAGFMLDAVHLDIKKGRFLAKTQSTQRNGF
jgi:hypothetical protein